MSLAQVELMCADCSVTVYPKSDYRKSKNGSVDIPKPAKGALESAKKRWFEMKERKARGEDVGLRLTDFEAWDGNGI